MTTENDAAHVEKIKREMERVKSRMEEVRFEFKEAKIEVDEARETKDKALIADAKKKLDKIDAERLQLKEDFYALNADLLEREKIAKGVYGKH